MTHLAVIGAGGFARFAVTEFVKLPGVQVSTVYDASRENAERLQSLLPTATIAQSFEAALDSKDVDLVYIATPPGWHYPQSKAALLRGKHVICEKPAALQLTQAIELSELAVSKGLLFVVNLMQRYNPLYDSVDQLIREKVLGDFLHGFFENYASDEFLDQQHWFWDETVSGGIFIEHGVHFFDLLAGWLGEGKVVASQKIRRQGSAGIWDRVQATVLYQTGLVNFYHGFDQPKLMDRQQLRLQFEKGDITLYEWVPTHMHLHAVCSDEELASLKRIFPGTEVKVEAHFHPPQPVTGRFKKYTVQHHIQMNTGRPVEKQVLYQQLVRSLLTDQLRWLQDKTHSRIIDHTNAVSSLKTAVEAESRALRLDASGFIAQ